MSSETLRPETARWLRYASEDLATAEALLALSSIPRRQVCLHAQQAAEKALKSGLVWLGMPVVKTHDIVFLQRRLPADWRVHNIADEDLNVLSSWAVESRYPGEAQEATDQDANVALDTARQVIAAVEADLAAAGYLHPQLPLK